MADDIDDVRERLARNLVEQKPVLDLLAKSDSTDACARCSHPRDLHVTSCRQSWQEPDSETGPAGTYVCGCERFVEPMTPDVRGVPVWRWPRTHNRPGHDYRGFYVAGDESGTWHRMSDEAQAAREEALTLAISIAIDERSDPRDAARAAQRVLGLGGDADATNGGG